MIISADIPLEELLKKLSDLWPSDAPNQSLYRMVYGRGQGYKAAALPPEIEQRDLGWCFDNSLEVWEEHGLAYVEGFAISHNVTGLPIHHAWNITDDGHVVDSTWVPAGLEYYGVEVEIEDSMREAWTTPLGIMT